MTADQDGQNPEAWLNARLAAGLPAETWKLMARIDGCAFSYYEVSDTGLRRSLDRPQRNGRAKPGGPLSTRPRKDGYVHADFYCDDPAACPKGGRHTLTMHKVVLTAFDKPCPAGMEASHLHGNPAWNWFPEAVAWEDKPSNERRKTWRPPPPEPSYPCRNAPACRGRAVHEGRRCRSCAVAAGVWARAELDEGRPLAKVASHLEVSERWAFTIAVEHGGYAGTIEQAKGQRPPLAGWRRAAARLLKVA